MDLNKILKGFGDVFEKEVLDQHFIKWTGDNLADVVAFMGPGNKFNNWYKSCADGNIFKIFNLTGYYEVPAGSWIAKAPDGVNYPMGPGVKYVSFVGKTINIDHLNLDDIDMNIEHEIPITMGDGPVTTYYPEDLYENEVVDDGHGFSLRRKLDKDGKPILKKNFHYPYGWNKGLTELGKFATKK